MYKISSVNRGASTSALVKLARLGVVHPSNFTKIANPAYLTGLTDDLARATQGGATKGVINDLADKLNFESSLYNMDNMVDPETLGNIGLAGGVAGAGGLAGLLYKNKKDAYNPGALARLFGAKARGGVDSRTLNALGALGLVGAGAKGYSMLDDLGHFDAIRGAAGHAASLREAGKNI